MKKNHADAAAGEDLKLKFVCLTSQKRSTMKTSAVSRDRMPIATESDCWPAEEIFYMTKHNSMYTVW